ncbi:hypothetical protein D3C76_487440 [compost metagenome]
MTSRFLLVSQITLMALSLVVTVLLDIRKKNSTLPLVFVVHHSDHVVLPAQKI